MNQTVTFPDGAVYTMDPSTLTISYTGPQGPASWTWATRADFAAAILAVASR